MDNNIWDSVNLATFYTISFTDCSMGVKDIKFRKHKARLMGEKYITPGYYISQVGT